MLKLRPQHARRELLKHRPRQFRSDVARGLVAVQGDRIERTGGDYSAGLIRGVSICTRGEALGHSYWLDGEFIASVTDAIAARAKGIKARFTHPGISGDGLGTFLGRVKGPRTVGDKTIGDLHFSQAAHHTPDGDLAGYIMDLAAGDPDAFGMSIVFEPDWAAEDDFYDEHKTVVEQDDGSTRYEFISPDGDNKGNMPHARLKELRASDMVDDPAANPDGLFHREQQFAQEADAILTYSLGLCDAAPACVNFSVHPDRVKGFVTRFMEAHGLRLTKKDKETIRTTDDTVHRKLSNQRAECRQFIQAFGSIGSVWFSEGLTFEQARQRHTDKLTAENDAMRNRLAALSTYEEEPVSFVPFEE